MNIMANNPPQTCSDLQNILISCVPSVEGAGGREREREKGEEREILGGLSQNSSSAIRRTVLWDVDCGNPLINFLTPRSSNLPKKISWGSCSYEIFNMAINRKNCYCS